MLLFDVIFLLLLSLCVYPLTGIWGLPRGRAARAVLSLGAGLLCLRFRVLALAALHLLAILGLVRVLCRIFRLPAPRPAFFLLTLLTLCLVFAAGYRTINRVEATPYTLISDKLLRDYRLVFLADVHYGTVQKREVLTQKVAEINALAPDAVILGGDLLDEGADRAAMEELFDRLGQLQAPAYLIYGNHDRQLYSRTPAYSRQKLARAIEEAGITILAEETVALGPDLTLLGREDLASARKAGHNAQGFLLVADHQPFSAAENAALGADLQLSGHTHGGQIWPLGHMPFFFKGYVYGHYRVEQMDLLVSSGFAGWGFPVRTQGISEYLVIDLKKAA